MLATNGFGGSKDDFDARAPSYAKRGFAFLAYSGLGFGGSGCKIELDDPDYDGKAGSQLVSFLGGSKAAQDGTKIKMPARSWGISSYPCDGKTAKALVEYADTRAYALTRTRSGAT